MSTCRCGRQTTGRLCADCRRDDRWSGSDTDDQADGDESDETALLAYRCVECDAEYESEGLGPCPECGAYRARCLGKSVEVKVSLVR